MSVQYIGEPQAVSGIFGHVIRRAQTQNGWRVLSIAHTDTGSTHHYGIVMFQEFVGGAFGTAAFQVRWSGNETLGETDFSWGHYGLTYTEATSDFAERHRRGF